jgi:hypothetical protein
VSAFLIARPSVDIEAAFERRSEQRISYVLRVQTRDRVSVGWGGMCTFLRSCSTAGEEDLLMQIEWMSLTCARSRNTEATPKDSLIASASHQFCRAFSRLNLFATANHKAG